MAGGSGSGGGGGGKITKLLKKVQSIGKSNRRPSRTSSSSTNSSSRSSSEDYATSAYNNNNANTRISYTDDDYSACSYNKTSPSPNCTVVYVGQSKRRYILSTEVTEHPLFQELIIERESRCGDGVVILVSCEVVLFEHLLWMLQNADPDQPAESSVDELADYYACS